MQPEEGYLWEVSQLMHAIIESKDLAFTLAARDTLHKHVYTRMADYGFKSKEEVRQSVHYWRSGQADPTKQMRSDRLERWGKGEMTKLEKDALRSLEDKDGLKIERFNVSGALRSVGKKWFDKDIKSPDKTKDDKDFERE